LTRYRTTLVRERAAEVNRLQKTLEGANIKLASVATDIMGKSGREMLDALVAGSTYRHLAKWAGMCPGNNESAGKRKSGKTAHGNPWLRAALVQAAHAAGRTATYLAAQLHRLTTRRGKKKAVVAVAHTQLVIAYHVIKNPVMYAELGQLYFDERDRDAVKTRLVRRLEKLGFMSRSNPGLPRPSALGRIFSHQVSLALCHSSHRLVTWLISLVPSFGRGLSLICLLTRRFGPAGMTS